MAPQDHRKIIFLIFIASFIVRLCFVFYLDKKFYFDDEYEYWKMVNNFLSGKGLMVAETLKAYRPPLYPLFLAMLVKMHAGIPGIRIVQSFISAVTCILIYIVGKKIYNEKVAIMSACISAIYPFFIFYTGFLLTETLFIFLVVLSILTVINLEKSETFPSYGLLTGAVIGFAGLCRPTMELFFPFCLIFILLSRDLLYKKIRKVLFACAGFIIVLSPWITRNYIAIGKFIPGTTMGGAVFWEGNNPYSEGGPCRYFPEGAWKVEESRRDSFFYNLTFEYIRKDPARFVKLLGKKFLRFWNIVPNAAEYTGNLYRLISVLSFGLLLPFFILGMFMTDYNENTIVLTGIIVFFTLFHMVYLASIRYRVAIEPFYILLACYGFLWFLGQFKKFKKT